MENYNKIALDTPDLLAMLKQRGLQVPNEQEALQTLSSVSYFRIACYFRPMEINKQTHEFREGATLTQVLELYKFDTDLRDMVFGATKLYQNFYDKANKKAVAEDFGLPQHEFLNSWMESLTSLRNFCAHHSRIWNRRYAVKPQMPRTLAGHKWLTIFSFPPDKIYPQLCCIAYLLNAIDSQNTFSNDLKRLLKKYPSIDVAAMGFPKGWKKEPLWK